MRGWLREHGLTLFLAGVWLGLLIGQLVTPKDTVLNKVFADHSGAFAALWVFVLATKWLRERGSKESK